MTTIFLSASSLECVRLSAVVSRLDGLGLTITQRWWEPSAHGTPEEWSGRDGELSREVQAHLARANQRAINASSAYWMLWPVHGMRTTAEAELGYALSRQDSGLRVVVTGPRSHESTWTSIADYRDADDLCGLAEVTRFAMDERRRGNWRSVAQ